MTEAQDYDLFQLGEVPLQEGATLRDAFLAYKTYGTLNDAGDNVILYPTWYAARHWDNEWLIGEGMALDPSRYFIIVPNMLGNGLSSSPSNTPPPYGGVRFPNVTMVDNVAVQHRLLTEHFGIEQIELVTGWSLGAAQTFQWAVSHPEMVKRILPFCGASKASEHNIVGLEGAKAALTADKDWNHGVYTEQPTVGLRAMGRVCAGWSFSAAFYRNRAYLDLGFSSLEDFLVAVWEGFFLDDRDANNLLRMLWTWQNVDVGRTPGFDGSQEGALATITATAIVMAAQGDMFFPPEDEEAAVALMTGADAELRVIPTTWGHFAGGGLHEPDIKFIDDALKELLAK